MKVTFINMPLRESALPNTPPEGPLILSSILRNDGIDVHVLDLNAYRIKDELSEKKGLPNGRHLTYREVEDLIYKCRRSRRFCLLGQNNNPALARRSCKNCS